MTANHDDALPTESLPKFVSLCALTLVKTSVSLMTIFLFFQYGKSGFCIHDSFLRAPKKGKVMSNSICVDKSDQSADATDVLQLGTASA